MQSTVARSKELWSGLLFLAIGCVAAGMALQYSIGTISRMGPGYFPLALGAIVALLGLIFVARAFAFGGTPLGGSNPFAILCVLGSASIFAGLLEALGLAISAFLLVVAAYAGGSEFHARRMIALSAGLAVFVVVLFAMLLKLQVPIGPMPWS
jgi:hypothetical protein